MKTSDPTLNEDLWKNPPIIAGKQLRHHDFWVDASIFKASVWYESEGTFRPIAITNASFYIYAGDEDEVIEALQDEAVFRRSVDKFFIKNRIQSHHMKEFNNWLKKLEELNDAVSVDVEPEPVRAGEERPETNPN